MHNRWLLSAGLAIGVATSLRLASAGLGFVAGAAAGLVVAYFADRTRSTGEGRLENYFAIPLALGTVRFMTIFVALGD